MTIISTKEQVTALDLGEGSLDLFDNAKKPDTGLPPLNDTIVWFNNIDWAEVRQRCRGGVNNCGLVIAVIGEKMHDLGVFLAEV